MCPEGQEEADAEGDELDPTALFGVFWDHDNDSTTDNVPYEFEDTYENLISDLADENRDEKIATIKRDGEYTRRTAEDIGTLIHNIQRGHDHDPDLWTLGNGRENGQYGHTPVDPGPRASSLQDFITAGNPGVGVLVKARGISRGIADAAHEDLEAIRALIGEIQKYKDKAMAAKQALADEADRLVAVEILKLIGPEVFEPVDPNNPNGPSQRVLGGSEKVKREAAAALLAELETLQNANSDQMTIDAETMEIARLEGEKTRLEGEKTTLEGHADKYDPESGNYDATYTTPDCTDADDCRAQVAEKDTEIMAVDDDLTAERNKPTDRQAAIDAKRAEWEAKLAEADADVAKAEELRTEAAGLDRDAANIQDEIDAITAQEAALRGDPNNPDPDNPVSLADLEAALQRCCGGRAKERLEHTKAEQVQSYLRGALRTAVNSGDSILKGEAVNFMALATQDAAGNVFARATPPAGTVIARDALGSVIERTIEGVDNDGDGNLDNNNLQALKERIGTHRALVLEPIADGAPAGFTLPTDSLDQIRYTQISDEDAADHDDGEIGEHFVGTLNGIHGTLYIDEVFDPDTFTAENRWFFTPSLDDAGGNLRGGNPELFRYQDNGDGTYTLVPHVDYGAWLAGETTLRLNLLAGVVGPDANHYKTVDVTTAHDDQTNSFARNGLLPATATYTGDAQGLAARTDSDTGLVASGHFTADVELNATFGANPTLGGTIDTFRSADPTDPTPAHVNPDWAATLVDSDLTSGTVDRGTVSGTGVNGGEWTGVAWGTDPVLRPDGVYGGFRIDFTDGAAAGVYSAE